MARIRDGAIYVVDVISRGIKQTGDQLKKVGASAKAVSGNYDGAERAAGGFFNTQAKGVIGTANSTKSFSKLAETINGGSNSLVGAYATLAANIFAVSAAFNALRSAAQVQQVLGGLEAAGNRVGLTYSVATQRIKEMGDGMLSTEQAARSAAQVFAGGFKLESLERMTKLSKDVSIGLGRNMTDSMDRLSRGVIKLEPELLDELGIMTKLGESNAIYAATLNKSASSLTNFEKRQGYMNAVLAEGELKFGDLSASAGNTTAYDKLAATFSDLTKTIFGAFTGIFGPIVNLLSQTKLGLAGVGLLFAATIRKQLMPGLSQASERMTKLAEQQKKMASLGLNANKKSISNIPELKKELPEIKALRASINSGAVSLKSYDDTMAAIVNKQKQLNKELAEGNTLGSKAKFNRLEQQGVMDAQMAVIQKARDAQQKINKNNAQANIQGKAALAISEAGQGNPIAGMFALKDSVKAFSETGGKAGEAATKLQTGMFAAGKGVSFLGATILRVLPWLGLITVAFGALALAIRHLQGLDTKEYKAFESALSALTETTEQATDKLEALAKVEENTASLSLRTAESMKIKGNAISELATRYTDLIKAHRDYEAATALKKEEKDKGGFKVLWTMDDVRKEEAASRLREAGIRQSSVVGKNFGALSATEEGTALLKNLNAINKFDSSAFNREMGKYREQLKAAGNDTGELAVIGEAMATGLARSFGGMADAVDQFQNNIKALGNSMQSFLTSAMISTPYDDVVQKLNAVDESILTLRSTAASVGSNEWKNMLAGLTPEVTQFMDASVKAGVDQLNVADATVKRLEEQVRNHQKLTSTEKDQLNVARDTLKNRDGIVTAVDNAFSKLKETFLVAQQHERISKSELAILQARGQASARINGLTAAGVRAQLQNQNRIIRLEIKGLDIQKSVLANVVKQQQFSAAELEFLKQGNAERMRADLLTKRAIITEGQLALARITTNFESGDAGVQEAQRAAAPRFADAAERDRTRNHLKTIADGLDKQIALSTSIINKQTNARDAQASIVALTNQQVAAGAALLTDAEIQAQASQKNLENLTATLNTVQQIRDVYTATITANRSIGVLLSGNKDTLDEEILGLKRVYDQQIVNATTQARAKLAALGMQKAQADAEIAANKANGETITEVNALYKQNLDVEMQLVQATYEQLKVQTQLAILEKVVFNTRKEGIEWQKDGVSYLQQELDATRAVQEATLEIERTRENIANKKFGSMDNPRAQNAQDIKAASFAYKLAVEEAGIKKTIIRLEFELLREQRRQLLDNLQTRKRELLAARDPNGNAIYDENSDMVKQVSQSIGNLVNSNFETILGKQLKSVDQGVEQKRLESVMARTTQGIANPMMDSIRGFNAENKALREAYLRDQETAAKPTTEVKVVTDSGKEDPVTKRAREAFEAQAQKSVDLITALDNLRKTIENKMEALSTSIAALNTPVTEGPTPTSSAAPSRSEADRVWKALLQAESNGRQFDANGRTTTSDGGALGIAQLMPQYAHEFARLAGEEFSMQRVKTDAAYNEKLGRALFDSLIKRFNGDMHKAISAYNAGGGAVSKAVRKGGAQWEQHLPKAENRNYYNRVMSKMGRPAAIQQPAASTPPTPRVIQAAAPQAPLVSAKVPEIVEPAKMATEAPAGLVQTEQVITVIATKSGEAAENIKKMDESPPSNLLRGLTQIADQLKMGAEQFRALGPEGEVAALFSEGMGKMIDVGISTSANIKDSLASINSETATSASKFSDYATIASDALNAVGQGIGMVAGIHKASASAKIAGIDSEIAAEQRRDGKSAESIAKIQAMEKRKEATARKAFNVQKKLSMAQAVVSTAAAVASALATQPFLPMGPIMAGIAGAMGAAQLAIIAGTSYQSSAANVAQKTMPTNLKIGTRGDGVDVAKSNPNVGGELAYLRGGRGTGSNSSNFSPIGSAYGGPLPRGYGHNAFVVGEKGPEVIERDTPISVRPMNDNENRPAGNATFHIQAFDGESVQNMLNNRRGDIIDMLREAANANGSRFMEDVKTSHYKKAGGGATRI